MVLKVVTGKIVKTLELALAFRSAGIPPAFSAVCSFHLGLALAARVHAQVVKDQHIIF
jgi:hypothetical protein